MAVTVEMQHTGDPASQLEVAAVIEHVLADRPGDWRVSIVGSQANDRWEMKIVGPNAFERSYNIAIKGGMKVIRSRGEEPCLRTMAQRLLQPIPFRAYHPV